MKYRQAIKDMNRYDDASEEDLARENTCIICREDMHVWNQNDPSHIERTRPKKLPCGHILHLGCLKSWMERQQVCPTCRRSVVIDDASNAHRNRDNAIFRMNLMGGGAAGVDAAGAGAGAGAGAAPAPAAGGANIPQNQAFPAANGHAPAPGAPAGAPGQGADANHHHPPPPPNGGGAALRMFNFGPLRLGFAQGGARDIQEMAQRLGLPNAMAGGNPEANQAAPVGAAGAPGVGTPLAYHVQPAGPAFTMSQSTSTSSIFQDLQAIERRIEQGTIELQLASAEARTLRTMLSELQRIRSTQYIPPTAPVPTPTQPLDPTAPMAPATSETEAQTAEPASDANPTEQAPAEAPQEGEASSSSLPPQATDGATPLAPAASGQASQAQASLQQSQETILRRAQVFAPLQPSGAATQFWRYSGPQTQLGRGAPGFGGPSYGQGLGNVPPVGSSELPPSIQIPPGWSLLPLEHYDFSPRAFADDDTTGQAGPSNGSASPQPGPSIATAPTASTEASPDTTASSLRSTVETAPERAAPAAASTTPIWGGSAQLYGSSSQTGARPTRAQGQQNEDESSSESSNDSSEGSSDDS